jgi:hypothetical protein
MSQSFEDAFKDKEYCFEQIKEARKLFGNKNTTEEQYEAMEKVLGFAYLYCPEEIKSLVFATLNEAERRKIHFILNIWGKK